MRKPFIKINIEDLVYAKEFFDNTADYMLWVYAVTEYYQGNEITIKKKIVKKYFDNYKKTMNIVIESKKFGKDGYLKKIENQINKLNTLEDPLKHSFEATLKEPHAVNSKEINNKEENNINIEGFLSWFNMMKEKYVGSKGKFSTLNKTTINNLKQLKQQNLSTSDWEHAFKMMCANEWVKQNQMQTPSHFLVNDNFYKYLNQEDNSSKFDFAWNR